MLQRKELDLTKEWTKKRAKLVCSLVLLLPAIYKPKGVLGWLPLAVQKGSSWLLSWLMDKDEEGKEVGG